MRDRKKSDTRSQNRMKGKKKGWEVVKVRCREPEVESECRGPEGRDGGKGQDLEARSENGEGEGETSSVIQCMWESSRESWSSREVEI